MAKDQKGGGQEPVKEEKLPLGQVLFDDMFLLLALGVGLPLVSYVVWALIDLSQVPVITP